MNNKVLFIKYTDTLDSFKSKLDNELSDYKNDAIIFIEQAKTIFLNGVYYSNDNKELQIYSATNGCLVNIGIKDTIEGMMTIHIIGNGYDSRMPVNTIVNFYNYSPSTNMYNVSAIHFGNNFGNINVFNYNGYIHLWFKQLKQYESFIIKAYNTNNKPHNATPFLTYTNEKMPIEGVTKLVSITPKQGALKGIDTAFNGVITYANIDNCKTKGIYLIDRGTKTNNVNIYNILTVDYVSDNSIRQCYIGVEEENSVTKWRVFNGTEWGDWTYGMIDGANILNDSIPNSKLANASVTPAPNTIPISNEDSALLYKNLKSVGFALGSTMPGWIRVGTFKNDSGNGILQLWTTWKGNGPNALQFAISVAGVSKPNISQLSGVKYGDIITKIRVLYGQVNKDTYVDILWNGNANNQLYVSAIGDLICYTPIVNVEIPENYNSYEFETVNGFKANDTQLISNGVIYQHHASTNLYRFLGYAYSSDTDPVIWKDAGPALGFGVEKYHTLFQGGTQNNNLYLKSCYNGAYTDWRTFAFTDSNVASADKLTVKKLSDENLNALTSEFAVYNGQYNNTCANKPRGVTTFALSVFKENELTTQVLYSKSDVYIRQYKGSAVWSDWKKFLTEDDLANNNIENMFNGIVQYDDIDSCKTDGYYIIDRVRSTGNENIYNFLLVKYISDDNITQTYIGIEENMHVTKYRKFNGTSWSAWTVNQINGNNILNNSIPYTKLGNMLYLNVGGANLLIVNSLSKTSDMNDLPGNYEWYFSYQDHQCKNLPEGIDAHSAFLLFQKYMSNYGGFQFITDGGSGFMWVRHALNNYTAWGEWERVLTSKDLSALSNNISLVKDEDSVTISRNEYNLLLNRIEALEALNK